MNMGFVGPLVWNVRGAERLGCERRVFRSYRYGSKRVMVSPLQMMVENVDVEERVLREDEDEGMREEKMREEKAREEVVKEQEWKFFDWARVYVKGGDGGNGCLAMRREKGVAKGGPAGGSGGTGGSVYFEADRGRNTLARFRGNVHFRATGGKNGQGKARHGEWGDDEVVKVPLGTVVYDESGEAIGDLYEHGQRLLVAKGGRGGRGNAAFKTDRNVAPRFCEKGEPGEEHWLRLELKLVADIGIIGIPNAGKSTLLRAVSNARPEVASYPFTTVIPTLGVCDTTSLDGLDSIVFADIPGLLEGAHDGKGLGTAFLRHIERCRVLIHLVSGDAEDPFGDYEAINQELELFSPLLAKKTQVRTHKLYENAAITAPKPPTEKHASRRIPTRVQLDSNPPFFSSCLSLSSVMVFTPGRLDQQDRPHACP